MSNDFTLGVEGEYQIVDAHTRALRPREKQVLAGAEAALGERVQPEFHASQIEIATPVCQTLDQARTQLIWARMALLSGGCDGWPRRADRQHCAE